MVSARQHQPLLTQLCPGKVQPQRLHGKGPFRCEWAYPPKRAPSWVCMAASRGGMNCFFREMTPGRIYPPSAS